MTEPAGAMSPSRCRSDPPATRKTRSPVRARRRTGSVALPLTVAFGLLLVAMALGVAIGPADISLHDLGASLLVQLPGLHGHVQVAPLDQAIVWQLRMPRVVLGALVGSMLAAGGGAAYQGTFRNPLADPYLLGVAAGAGLGATVVIVAGHRSGLALPLAAFLGALGAVALTYLVAASGGQAATGQAIVLAGVAVAALLTAVQTYLQQKHTSELQQVYNWLLGSLAVASWSDVLHILPYVVLSGAVLLAHGRLLDVLRVGEDEAAALGIDPQRTRLIVVAAATLGTAAAVSVTGLIGFIGIVVPHAIRLTCSASYRVLLPVSMVGGAAFLVLADIAARTVQAPAEVPIGVVTAFIGASFFLFVLRSRRVQHGPL